ncbi:unnamed protein product [Cuscuta epithymum]|uniref:Uncharacterized protein n=1 Tax=Cuscuta epithymum TaxID=186058 RepID=A0AAV0E2C7_9ASTE|nr:unnamed protein product [Cuscuta epithymum]
MVVTENDIGQSRQRPDDRRDVPGELVVTEVKRLQAPKLAKRRRNLVGERVPADSEKPEVLQLRESFRQSPIYSPRSNTEIRKTRKLPNSRVNPPGQSRRPGSRVAEIQRDHLISVAENAGKVTGIRSEIPGIEILGTGQIIQALTNGLKSQEINWVENRKNRGSPPEKTNGED